MHPKHQYPKRRIASLLFFVAILAALGLGWLFRQDISDWYRLRNYDPSAEVVALADQDTMTAEARRIFYTTHPSITGEDDFNANCRQGGASEYSIVLGCYVSSGGLNGNMFLYDIDDERLNGVMQVTAAHEMLHAAYERLGTKERERVDAMLMETYRALPGGRIKDTIAQYEKADPAAVPSELHSILGTELAVLLPALEDYYRQYFTNRQAVVGYSEQYEGEFTRRQDQVAQYDAQLVALKASIEADQQEIDSRRADLDQQQQELESQQADPAAFNALVSDYNQQVAAYNALVQQTRADIEEYNRLVEVRNDLALEVKELTEAIDSRPETL
jgi:hypothetical protein